MSLLANLTAVKKRIPADVTLVIVSKTQPVDLIRQLYDMGHRDFGENKVQEFLSKQSQLPDDIRWHFIGHLQRNKVSMIIPSVKLIHSVDSFRLLEKINKEAKAINQIVDCLLQFHIATEETKFGMTMEEARYFLVSPAFRQMKNVQIRGVMGMATFTPDKALVINEFNHLFSLFALLKQEYFRDTTAFDQRSMGMTSDYEEAIQEGSTLVRIGTAIFGNR